MSDKVAVYAGTRNVYPQMYTSLKSLLINNQMDRVYLLIEDMEFPYPVPKNVILMDVSEQNFFPEHGANTKSRYSYMELMRSTLGYILPNEELVLWLDIDTIIDDDITDLFAMNMDGFFYAGCIEPMKSKDIFQYVNSGVLLCNLPLLRGFNKEAEEIAFLNLYRFNLPGQEVINLLCQGRIRIIDSTYNSNAYTFRCNRPKIIHYAAITDYKDDWAYRKYELKECPGLEDEEEKTEDKADE